MRATLGGGLALAAAALLAPGCRTTATEADRAELLRLHDAEREAHIGKDAALLVAQFSDDFVQLNRGKIDRADRETVRARMQAYFDRADFLAWDDVDPPEIRMSSDGTMAWKLVHKIVRIAGEPGEPPSETVFAWLAVYEKREGHWRLRAVASTNG